MMLLFVAFESEAQTVACDACTEVLDPGEWGGGVWNAAEALSAAERRGWFITDTCHMCPGWHSLPALEALEAKIARRAAAS